MESLENHPLYTCTQILRNTPQKQICVFRHTKLGRFVLERILRDNFDPSVYQWLSQVSHPNLPQIYEVREEEDCICILEEYFDGIPLSTILEDRPFGKEEVKSIAIQLCNALEVLHRNGIVHRDIKPENVLIDKSGTVKLIDYDAAKTYKEGENRDTRALGTPGYAAPEQYGIAQSNERTDIFSLGVLINLLLTGEHPSVRLCGRPFHKIVRKCTVIENRSRYSNILALKRALLCT